MGSSQDFTCLFVYPIKIRTSLQPFDRTNFEEFIALFDFE